MKAIRVRIENGRITGEAPPGLPEGEVDLALADADDDMTDAELARLNDALERGFEAIKAGRFRPARDVVADLRRRHR
jgi:S-adenosylmethionine:diacylglycerol 3-amino-3-carboxypropyl transferase